MRNDFVNIVQKCICIDFIFNTLLNSNYEDYSNYLLTIKKENIRNIKIIVYIYESCNSDTIDIENINPIKLHNTCDDYYKILIEYSLSIVNSLESLQSKLCNYLYKQILFALKTNYFNFISLINSYNFKNILNLNNPTILTNDDIKLPLLSNDGFNLINSISNITDNTSYEIIRQTAIEAINLFFNINLIENSIKEEHYEIFFKNNPENKFYQIYFNSNNHSYKIRIWDKNLKVFYLFQTPMVIDDMIPSINKDDAKYFCNSYLRDKLGNTFDNIIYDDSYLNKSFYVNIPESYKFKYNISNPNFESNISRSLYITIDTRYKNICELSFL